MLHHLAKEYLDAVAPLLARSPRLVLALVAWMARLLKWYDLCWPTTRLVLLAAREPREKTQLPGHSLGRLPAEVIKGSWDLHKKSPKPAVFGPGTEGSDTVLRCRIICLYNIRIYIIYIYIMFLGI